MKRKAYINFINKTVIFIPMILLNWLLYWNIVYFGRYWIRKEKDNNKLVKFLWLFLNDTEKTSKNIDGGDYGRYSENWIGACRQNMVRNFFWNLRMNYLTPKKGDYSKKVGTDSTRLFNNNKPLILGYTKIFYPSEDGKEWYFRRSKGAKLPFNIPWVKNNKIIWYTHYCYQLGSNEHRYLAKFHLMRN